MYDELKDLVKRFANTNNIASIVVGGSTWYKLQKIVSDLYGPEVNNPDFWGDIFFDICYDLNINVIFED